MCRLEHRRKAAAKPPLWGAALLLVGVSLSQGGCPPRAANPQATLKDYVAAMQSADYARAYALMAKGFRREYDRDEFISHHKRNRADVKRNLKELKQGPSKLKVHAEYKYGDGNRLKLVMEKGAWKLALDPVTFYSQRTPRRTLRSFIRALERRRFRIILRFVPRDWRRVMTVRDIRRLFSKKEVASTQRLIRNLKANVDNKIEVKGNEAVMLYGDRFKVQFKREDGLWKVVDAD